MTDKFTEHGEAGLVLKDVLSKFNDLLTEELGPLGKYMFYTNFIFLPTNGESNASLNFTLYTRPVIDETASPEDQHIEVVKYMRMLSVSLADDPFITNSVLSSLLEKNEQALEKQAEKLLPLHDVVTGTFN